MSLTFCCLLRCQVFDRLIAAYSLSTVKLAESAAMVADLQHQLVEARAQLAAATKTIAALLAELSAARDRRQEASAAAENAQQGREAKLHAALKGAATQQQQLLLRIQHLEGQVVAARVKEQQQHQLVHCLQTDLAAQQAALQAALPAEKHQPAAQPKTALAAANNIISCSGAITIPTQPSSNHTSSCSSNAQLAGRTSSAATRTNSCSRNARLFCSTSTTASRSSNAPLAGTSSAATRPNSCSRNAQLSRSTSTTASRSSKSRFAYNVSSVSSSDSKGSSSMLPSPVVFISATWPAADIATQQQQQGEAATVLHRGNFNQFRAGYGNVDKRKVGERGAAVVHAIEGYTLLVCEGSGGTANSSSSSGSVSYDCPPAAVREVAQVELQQFKEEWAAIEMVQCKTNIVMPITAAWFVAEEEVNGMVFGRAYYLTPLARMSLYDLLKQLDSKQMRMSAADTRVVLATLLHLLELGLVHADLKPENLVIDHKGRLQIIDTR